MKIYHFMDMASGGAHKTDYDYIYVIAKNEKEAANKFELELDLDPFEVTCDCCGDDFSTIELEKEDMETEGNIKVIT